LICLNIVLVPPWAARATLRFGKSYRKKIILCKNARSGVTKSGGEK
jgi:hypothetical protein